MELETGRLARLRRAVVLPATDPYRPRPRGRTAVDLPSPPPTEPSLKPSTEFTDMAVESCRLLAELVKSVKRFTDGGCGFGDWVEDATDYPAVIHDQG